MPRKRRTPQSVLEEYRVDTKAGRLRFLVDVVKAYEELYPARFRFYLNQFKKLRQVMKQRGYTDAKGRMVWSDNVPTEPFLYVQRWIPNFGSDPEWPGDMELLKKAWEDFVCTPKRKHLKRTTFWKGDPHRGTPQAKKATIFPQVRPGLVDEQGRPLVSDQDDPTEDRAGGDTEHPPVSDGHHPGRPGGAGEVPLIG